MDQVIDRCAGLDVHNHTVAACVRVPGNGRQREQHVRTFGTTTAELLGLHDWLAAPVSFRIDVACASAHEATVRPAH